MKHWIPKKQIIVVFICGAVLSALIYFTGLSLAFMEIGKIENIYNNNETKSAKYQRAMSLQTFIDGNQGYLSSLKNFFIKNDDEIKFIEQIEEIGKKSGIVFEIDSINDTKNKDDKIVKEILIKVKMEGEWGQVVGFVDSLEKMPFGVSIQTLSLDVNANKKWSGSVEFIVYKEK